ncbi:MAG: HlyD family efflux transporter periplasmic adaptor subunit [Holophagaceae bacterium]|nr:HlyD family efflux transporter periplasmic adaptor subunit [Holophagaceae bacterium]
MKALTTLALMTGLLGSTGCGRDKAAAEATESHEAHGGHGSAKGSSPKVPLKEIRGLRLMQVPESRREGAWYPAEAIGDEGAQIILSAPVKGIVSGLPASPGRPVGQGATLAVVQSPELARLKADWISAKAKLERADSEAAREVKLYEAQAGSRRELEAARSEAASARAEEEATRLALEARGLRPDQAGATFTVRSPRPGVVGAWKVQVGQGIEAGQELGTFQGAFAALAKVELPLPVPEAWTPGAATKVRASDGHQWQGRLESAPMALSQDTRRLSYRLRLSGAALPMAGTPLEVYIPLAQGVSLPQSALQQMEGVWGVFVGEGDFGVFRPVKRGVELGTEVLVLEGVKPGETVVAEGAYLLKALQQKRSEPAEGGGHGH